jgi:N6-L-threonylcarbamoyladenine synthase
MHVEALPSVLTQALEKAALTWSELDAIAVTYGPGLSSSLIVGVSAAKALSLRLGCELYAVNHLHGHIFSGLMVDGVGELDEYFPFLSLVVSGGHTCLVRVDGLGDYTLLGQTIDDAAGEAFDKGANLLGLGYPGGPAIDKVSHGGETDAVKFPRGKVTKQRGLALNPDFCFSYSGLKTALLYHLKREPLDEGGDIRSIAASYQEAIVDTLIDRCDRAMNGTRTLAVGGGVSLNSRLRERLNAWADEKGYRLMMTAPQYCADNAAMIATVAGLGQGICGAEALGVDVSPSLPVC